MNFKNKIAAVKSILRVKFISRRVPLIISWHLLDRCNKRCKYCFRWSAPSPELSTQEIFSLIDFFSGAGTWIIAFSGGEPLLREDMGEIINRCHTKGIFTAMVSNGSYVVNKINELKNLNMLKLSFDGPVEVHDFIRGSGSYKEVINAVMVAKKTGIKVKFNTTLTKYNIKCIDFILLKAKELNVQVKFQPLNFVHSAGRDISYLYPSGGDYREAIKKIINLKRYDKYIINSEKSLRYLYNWPSSSQLECYGGKLIFCISPKGELYPCTILMDKIKAPHCLNTGDAKSIFSFPFEYKCEGCWCTSTLEMNSFMAFNPKTVLNIYKLFG